MYLFISEDTDRLEQSAETPTQFLNEEQQRTESIEDNNYKRYPSPSLGHTEQHNSCEIFNSPESFSPQQNYDDSLEKTKDITGVPFENFSQQIERRAKEIRASGRRTQLQQIEFANRAKFRLENTLIHYEDIHAETKEFNCNKAESQTSQSSLFRIVVTDAQNNIIEEDSIGSLETNQKAIEADKENFNGGSLNRSPSRIENADELLMVRFSKDRLKEKVLNSGSLNSRTSGSLKRVPSKHRRQQYSISVGAERSSSQHLSVAEAKKLLLSPKSKERRVLSNQIYRARPVKVITTTTTTTTTTSTDSFRRNKVKHQSNKMSRPQILQVIDNKRKLENGSSVAACSTTTTTFNANQLFHNTEETSQAENEYLKKVDAVRCYWSKLVNNDSDQQKQQQQELHDASLADVEKGKPKENVFLMVESDNSCKQQQEQMSCKRQPAQKTNEMENPNESQPQTQSTPHNHHHKEQRYEEKKQFILGAHTPSNERSAMKNLTAPAGNTHNNNTLSTSLLQHTDDYSSFMPSIEIVELDGDKKATIVSAAPSTLSSLGKNEVNDADVNDASEPQFDHIRYKVLKSQQLLRSNILARNKKEAQFDGLIQYLQEYSFQELLSNNNVVIVEPVRTKIERPILTQITNNGSLTKDACPTKTSRQTQTESKRKQTPKNSNTQAGNGSGSGSGGGIKRHFFYQPVRVNRELYEDELPNPDTVRNVRKFFEEHILPTPGQGLLAKTTQQQQQHIGATEMPAKQTSPKTRRARKYRYLTIDTSYGHAATAAAAKQNSSSAQRKWDTASLSSGISSGDLSSPCESHDLENNNKKTPTASNDPGNKNTNSAAEEDQRVAKPIHVQDLVRKHNSSSAAKKQRSAAFGVPVRNSGIRSRSSIYGSLHKAGKSSSYRDIYEHNIRHACNESLDHADADQDEVDEDSVDDNDLFGDIEGEMDELCDTYYVSNVSG